MCHNGVKIISEEVISLHHPVQFVLQCSEGQLVSLNTSYFKKVAGEEKTDQKKSFHLGSVNVVFSVYPGIC